MTDSVNPTTPTFTKAGAKPCAGLLVNDGYRRAAVGILLGGVLTYYAGWRRRPASSIRSRKASG